jgi:hypothetical protein
MPSVTSHAGSVLCCSICAISLRQRSISSVIFIGMDLAGDFLLEWIGSQDGLRAFGKWAEARGGSFTRDEMQEWVNTCPEFQRYVEDRLGGVLADLKRANKIYEEDETIHLIE